MKSTVLNFILRPSSWAARGAYAVQMSTRPTGARPAVRKGLPAGRPLLPTTHRLLGSRAAGSRRRLPGDPPLLL